MAVVYQFNNMDLDDVKDFIENLGLSAKYRVLQNPPASGFGKLMQAKIDVKNKKILLNIIEQADESKTWAGMSGSIEKYYKKQWSQT